MNRCLKMKVFLLYLYLKSITKNNKSFAFLTGGGLLLAIATHSKNIKRI